MLGTEITLNGTNPIASGMRGGYHQNCAVILSYQRMVTGLARLILDCPEILMDSPEQDPVVVWHESLAWLPPVWLGHCTQPGVFLATGEN